MLLNLLLLYCALCWFIGMVGFRHNLTKDSVLLIMLFPLLLPMAMLVVLIF